MNSKHVKEEYPYRQVKVSCNLCGTQQHAILRYQIEEYSYIILLIITDGVIDDMTLSADLIVESSTLPLSIVIVGVGGADFSNMHKLDADEIPLVHSRTGAQMRNDIVQFVPMRAIKSRSQYFNLAKEVLAEVPGQVTNYMSNHNVEPRSAVPRVFDGVYGQTPYPPSDPYGAPQGYSYAAPPPPQAGGYPPYPVPPSAPPAI